MRIIHCFNWRLEDIEKHIEKIKTQKFDAIQINPIQPLKEDGLQYWWMSYQPVDFAIGNYFGSKQDLINLCKIASENEIKVFADVILNHMGSDVQNELEPHFKVNQKLKDNPDFWRKKIKVSNWKNRNDVIHHCINLPGLNVYNKDLEDIIVDFLNELIDCGVSGFRFDAAKSIGLPSEGYRFWPNIIYRLKKYGLFLYGEVIFEEDKSVLNEYSSYMKILGNYDCNNPSLMVKYIENHDTYLSDGELGYTRNIPSETIARNYFDLAENYENTLFYVRPFDDTWKSDIIRKSHQQKVLIKKH